MVKLTAEDRQQLNMLSYRDALTDDDVAWLRNLVSAPVAEPSSFNADALFNNAGPLVTGVVELAKQVQRTLKDVK